MTEADILLKVMGFAIGALGLVLALSFLCRGARNALLGHLSKEEQRERRQKELQDNLSRELLKGWMKDQWFK